MKDSHIDWIGAIPEDWSTIPFRRVFEITKRLAGRTGLDVLSVTQQGIKIKDLSSNEGQMAQDYSNYQLVFPTDFVMNHMDLLTGYVDISSYTGVTSPDYRVFRARKPQEISLEYFLHIFQLCYKCKIFYHLGQGVSGFGRWRLPAKQMLLFELPLPPLNEQQTIADFLNKKCGEIDEMVSLQEKIVEELKAYKQSVITEAVCKGLNPDIPMKDSGIEWIGQIPSHCRIAKIGSIITGYKAGPFGSALITGNLLTQGDILVYTPEHITKRETSIEGNLYLPPERLVEMSQFVVKQGEIIFPIVGSLGRAMQITKEMPLGIINQRLSKFSLIDEEVDNDYFMWVFGKSAFYSTFIDLHSRGAIIVNLTKQIVCNMPIVLHPLAEQRAISAFLNERCSEIDTLISVRQAKIEALKEYKKSIIYEYITGKKEING